MINIWDTTTGEIACALERDAGESVCGITWSPDENSIAIVSTVSRCNQYGLPSLQAAVSWLSVTDGTQLKSIDVDRIPIGTIHGINWSDQLDRIAIHSAGGMLLVDAKRKKVLRRIGPNDYLHSQAWSPDGQSLYGAGAHRLRCYQPTTGRVLWQERCEQFVLYALDISRDGKLIAVGDGHRIRVADAKTGKGPVFLLADPIPKGEEMRLLSVSFSQNADYVAAFSTNRGFVWHRETRKRIATFEAQRGSRGFSKLGMLFLYLTGDYFKIVDLSTWFDQNLIPKKTGLTPESSKSLIKSLPDDPHRRPNPNKRKKSHRRKKA